MTVSWSEWESWRPDGKLVPKPDQKVRELIRVVMALHSTFSQEIWLWRGQSDWRFTLEPGMHMRVRRAGLPMEEEHVVTGTNDLILAARQNKLDEVDGMRLPDLALLAHLQHHGAATPLLDVTVDPLVALWMVAHSSGADPHAGDDIDGALFGIRRPGRTLAPLDSRRYSSTDSSDIAKDIQRNVYWYGPPDISERLRIQRGSFLFGHLSGDGQVTLPLKWEPGDKKGWLLKRLVSLGHSGRPHDAGTEVVVFRVTKGMKASLREWLRARAGLTQDVIYPTPWHKPFLEQFCRSYDRLRPLDVKRVKGAASVVFPGFSVRGSGKAATDH